MDLEPLVDAYQKLVFTICFRFTQDYFEAENLTQDTFLSYWRRYGQNASSNPKSLLCTIAANRCRDYLKSSRQKTTAPYPPEHFSDAVSSVPTPEGALLDTEVQAKLYRLCGRLKEPYATVARLFYIEGCTLDEIQQQLGGKRKTLQTQLYRARNQLRNWWKEESS